VTKCGDLGAVGLGVVDIVVEHASRHGIVQQILAENSANN